MKSGPNDPERESKIESTLGPLRRMLEEAESWSESTMGAISHDNRTCIIFQIQMPDSGETR